MTPRDGPIDWGHVMMGDTVVQTLQLANMSELSIDFCLKMESIMLPQCKRKGMDEWIDGWTAHGTNGIMESWNHGTVDGTHKIGWIVG